MWESESESAAGREYGDGLLTSTKHGVKIEGFQQRGNPCMHAGINGEFLTIHYTAESLLFMLNFRICTYAYQPMITKRKTLLEGTPQSFQEGWTAAKKDINTLKFELESVKGKYLELQNDMENLQKQFDKMVKQKHTSAWSSGWKKLGKLTKMTNIENHDIEPQIPTSAEQNRKTTRRWRNSIS